MIGFWETYGTLVCMCLIFDFMSINRIRSFIFELTQERERLCLEFLQAILEVELTPFTQNIHYLQSGTDKWLARYKEIRSLSLNLPTTEKGKQHKSQGQAEAAWSTQASPGRRSPYNPPVAKPHTQGPPTLPSQSSFTFKANSQPQSNGSPSNLDGDPLTKVNIALATLAEIGYTGLTKESLGVLKPPDEYETELKVMAEVRGYFKVSYKVRIAFSCLAWMNGLVTFLLQRIMDNVPSLIDLKFIKAIGHQLQPFLISKLCLGTAQANESCERYFREDDEIVAQRTELSAQKERLESVKKELLSFGA